MPGVDGGDEIRNPLNMDDPGADNEEQPADSGEDGGAERDAEASCAIRYWTKRPGGFAYSMNRKRFTEWLDRFYSDSNGAGLRDPVPWGKADLAGLSRRSQEISTGS